MKTPTSIMGIPGWLTVVLWLAGPALAETSTPSAAATKADATPAPPAAAISLNVAREESPRLATPRLSPWTKEIVKLAQSGIEDGVMYSFIDNSGAFELGADQIIYLSDIGVSGQTINAMLQHDRELVSGERLPTITSEPPYEPLFTVKPVTSSKPQSQTIKSAATVPASAPAAATVAANVSGVKTSSASEQSYAMAQQPFVFDDLQVAGATAPNMQRQAPAKKQSLYPVREPYPVELLPPIVFINMPEVTPNTLIVYGFPKP